MHERDGVYVAVATFDFSLPACFSLKEKRSVLRGLLDKLRHGYNISLAEVAHQDAHTRSVIAVSCVGSDRGQVERVMNAVERTVLNREGVEVNHSEVEWC